MNAHQIIYEDHLHRIEFFPAQVPSNTVIVSFTERGGGTLDGRGFGGGFLHKKGFDVVAIKSKADRWYHDLPSDALSLTSRFLAACHRDYTVRAGYGSSMGGYAAIKFSRTLGLDKVLAISPQTDISKEWDQRWKKEAQDIGTFAAIVESDIRPETTYSVAYDPFDPDGIHVSILSSIIPPDRLIKVRVPFAGHPVGFLLQSAGVLGDVALSAFRGEVFPDHRMKTRAARASSAPHLAHMSRMARAARKSRWARILIERSLDLDGLNAENVILASQLAEEGGDLPQALRYSALAAALSPMNPYIIATTARHLEKTGHIKQALNFIIRSCELAPDHQPFKVDKIRLQHSLSGSHA
ncbi:tetratricopeptide repeat protein [Acetobacteraceae bacterium KSS8]|uniref:Tetratricopeptide repeat protein n=1 Tax=Endosaccharibacter trunci TaxID=2812733 RepID=A0ABT1W8T8_9PROT|nr:tetratricopeptide repeat protein [Acetobacteraceae bacterium KSS8]